MSKSLHVNRKTISKACCFMLLLSAAALALNAKSNNQHIQDSNLRDKDELLKRIQELPAQPLRVIGNDDCPLRLIEARVKEIPGPLFTESTGKTTALPTVSSVPEAVLVNTSGKTITRFFLAVRDPKSQITRGLMRSQILIKPGETFMVKREDFGGAERVTADENGRTRHMLVKPGATSEKRWLEFAVQDDTFVTVALVDFEDGSSWRIKEGGEIR